MLKHISTYRGLVIGAMLTIGLSSCLDQINYDLPPEDRDNLAIQGRLVKGDPHMIHVEVKRIFDFKGSDTFVYVDSVRLTNDQGQFLKIKNTDLGIYETSIPENDPDFEVREGGAYKITVWGFDGNTYESAFETLYPVVKVDSIDVRLIDQELPPPDSEIEKKDRVQFFINTPLITSGATERSRVNWFFEHTFQITDEPMATGIASKVCYISEKINIEKLKPMDGNFLNADYLSDYAIYETEINFKFQENFFLNVQQQSLSEGAAEYFTQVDKLLNKNGNMFESPVAELVSNFKNINDAEDKVFGYFYATAVDTFHVGISPYQIYVPIPGMYCPPPLPPPPDGECPLEICCDCLSAPVSTTTKPEYWF